LVSYTPGVHTESPDTKVIAEKSNEISALQAEIEREVIDHIL